MLYNALIRMNHKNITITSQGLITLKTKTLKLDFLVDFSFYEQISMSIMFISIPTV